MVALLPAQGVIRDCFLATGVGFLLGVLYRVLRLVLGNCKIACYVCDIAICVFGALLYRSAAAGVFESGIMRWYTMISLLSAYALCQKIFYLPFLKANSFLSQTIFAPFKIAFAKFNELFLKQMGTIKAKNAKKRAIKKQKQKRDLPNNQKMLYNSQ